MKLVNALAACFLFLLLINVPAQERSQEITIYHGILCAGKTELGCKTSKICLAGPIGVSFHTKLKNFGYGTSFYYSKGRVSETDYDLKSTYYNIFYDLKYYWSAAGNFKFHSGVGAGVTLQRAKEWDMSHTPQRREINRIALAYQFDILSVKFGKAFTFNMDIGYGRKGIVRMGLGYQFL